MKFAVVGWTCDLCLEESPAESNFTDARKSARKAGWLLGDKWDDGTVCDLCPECRKKVER